MAPLDLLWARRQILAGDYLAGQRYGFLARRRSHQTYAAAAAAALEALQHAGDHARRMVEMAVLDEQMPRTERGLEGLRDGLDALEMHFSQSGPAFLIHLRPGCRPAAARKWWRER